MPKRYRAERSGTAKVSRSPSYGPRGLRTAGLEAAALVAALAFVVLSIGSASGSSDASAGTVAATCSGGAVEAMIAGKHACLRRGQRCTKRLDSQYHRYWFHCHSGRLVNFPAAGKVVASIPVPAVGGLVVGGGAVWVANMNPRTVTRIDPDTNTVVATIALGDPDYSWGPTRLAFGHGSLWALDGKSSSVLRIDPQANRVVASIPLGEATQGSAASVGIVATSDAVWVANRWGTTQTPDGSVVRIDPQSNRIVARVSLGASPEDGGPTGITAGSGAIWVGVPSTNSVFRIDPASDSVVAEVPKLKCAGGQLAADEPSVWVADCTAVHRIDTATNAIARTIPMPRATGQGALGIAVGFGSVWVQAGPLVRIDPASGAVLGVLPLQDVWNDCAYSIAFGFDSVWVRQHDRVVRIRLL
jgi:virginiamycin B lyase